MNLEKFTDRAKGFLQLLEAVLIAADLDRVIGRIQFQQRVGVARRGLDDRVVVAQGEVVAPQAAVGLFLLKLFLDEHFAAGRHSLQVTWKDGSHVGSELVSFEVLSGGDGSGGVAQAVDKAGLPVMSAKPSMSPPAR